MGLINLKPNLLDKLSLFYVKKEKEINEHFENF